MIWGWGHPILVENTGICSQRGLGTSQPRASLRAGPARTFSSREGTPGLYGVSLGGIIVLQLFPNTPTRSLPGSYPPQPGTACRRTSAPCGQPPAPPQALVSALASSAPRLTARALATGPLKTPGCSLGVPYFSSAFVL